MREITARLGCTGCGCCFVVCPVGCISMVEDSEGFLYPVIEEGTCVSCGRCARACPANVMPGEAQEDSEYYMAQHRDPNILKRCSSGGVFDALAELVLSDGGVVFGAVREDVSGEVRHARAEDLAGIEPMRLSKYSQSLAWESYEEARACLLQHRRVLFTGTPCQLAGLRSYFGKLGDSPDLVTMEVLCHGVTSRRVVDAYRRSQERRLGKVVAGIRFRDKGGRWGWEDSSHAVLSVTGQGGVEELRDRNDAFMYGYIRSLYLRESCYRCRYCAVRRQSDFTAGDFWGLGDNRMPVRERRLGVSLMAVTGTRAKSLLPLLEKTLSITPIDVAEALPANGALVRPAKRPELRDTILASIDSNDFNSLLGCYFAKGILKRRIKSLIGPKVSKAVKTVKLAMQEKFTRS